MWLSVISLAKTSDVGNHFTPAIACGFPEDKFSTVQNPCGTQINADAADKKRKKSAFSA